MFARRTGWNTAQNAFSTALDEARAKGRELLDLTVSNTTEAGLRYPRGLLSALSSKEALRYAPDPRGMPSAREAVLQYYRKIAPQAALVPEQIFLTASTSEAYSFLFRLLCESGDEVLAL